MTHVVSSDCKVWPCVLGGVAVGGAIALGLAHVIKRPAWCGAKAAKRISGKPTLYTNPACPFAHRAWMTLVEKGVEFDTVMIPLSGEISKFKTEGKTSGIWAAKSIEQVEKIKADYKISINATGEVPSLTIGAHTIVEADVLSEFVEDNWKQIGTALLPACPLQRARTRHMLKVLSGGNGVMALYQALRNQDPAKDEDFKLKIYKHHAKFVELADPTGPFFLGQSPSFFDVMLAPFFYRFEATLSHYRGFDYIPAASSAPWAPRMQAWATAMKALPSYEQTKGLSPEVIIGFYQGYAGERGRSKPL